MKQHRLAPYELQKMSQQLDDLVHCPVCFEIYLDPQILNCLHVLCKSCADKIKKTDSIECPQCRENCPNSDVKNDFNKKTLVDVYNKQQRMRMRTNTNDSVQCEDDNTFTCQSCNRKNAVDCKCIECEKYICDSCKEDHQRFPALINHRFEDISVISTKIKSSLQSKLPLLQALKIKLAQRLIVEKKITEDLNELQSNTIADINKRRQTLKEAIDKQHDEVIKQVERALSQDMVSTFERNEIFTNFMAESDAKIDLVTELSDSNDMQLLVENGESIAKDIKFEITYISERTDTIKAGLIPQLTLTGPTEWDDKDGTIVSITRSSDTRNSDQKNKSQEGSSRNSNKEKAMTLYSQCGIDIPINRMKLVGDLLWITSDDGLYIYNQQYSLLKTIQLENIKVARSIIPDKHDQIVVACDGNGGLFLLDIDGKLLYEISDGSFSDAVINNGILYALVSRQPLIKVFVLKDQKGWFYGNTKRWTLRNSISLNYNQCSVNDALCVSNAYIYVSSFDNDCIFRYDYRGSVKRRFGTQGKTEKGKLWGPRICGLHPNDDVIVVDCCGKSILQCCSPSGEWKLFHLEGSIKRFKDAVFDETASRLWVSTGKDELVLFTEN